MEKDNSNELSKISENIKILEGEFYYLKMTKKMKDKCTQYKSLSFEISNSNKR